MSSGTASLVQKMSKKISQLTKVIHLLNSRADELAYDKNCSQLQYEWEINTIIDSANTQLSYISSEMRNYITKQDSVQANLSTDLQDQLRVEKAARADDRQNFLCQLTSVEQEYRKVSATLAQVNEERLRAAEAEMSVLRREVEEKVREVVRALSQQRQASEKVSQEAQEEIVRLKGLLERTEMSRAQLEMTLKEQQKHMESGERDALMQQRTVQAAEARALAAEEAARVEAARVRELQGHQSAIAEETARLRAALQGQRAEEVTMRANIAEAERARIDAEARADKSRALLAVQLKTSAELEQRVTALTERLRQEEERQSRTHAGETAARAALLRQEERTRELQARLAESEGAAHEVADAVQRLSREAASLREQLHTSEQRADAARMREVELLGIVDAVRAKEVALLAAVQERERAEQQARTDALAAREEAARERTARSQADAAADDARARALEAEARARVNEDARMAAERLAEARAQELQCGLREGLLAVHRREEEEEAVRTALARAEMAEADAARARADAAVASARATAVGEEMQAARTLLANAEAALAQEAESRAAAVAAHEEVLARLRAAEAEQARARSEWLAARTDLMAAHAREVELLDARAQERAAEWVAEAHQLRAAADAARAADTSLTTLRARLVEVESAVHERDAALSEAEAALRHERKCSSQERRRAEAALRELSTREAELRVALAQVETLQAAHGSAETTLTTLEAQLAAERARVCSLQLELTQAVTTLSEHSAAAQVHAAELAQARAQREAAQRQAESVQRAADTASAAASVAAAQMKQQLERLERCLAEGVQRETDLTETSERAARAWAEERTLWEARVEEAVRSTRACEEALALARAETTEAHARTQAAAQQHSELAARVDVLTAELAAAAHRHTQALESLACTHATRVADMRAQLDVEHARAAEERAALQAQYTALEAQFAARPMREEDARLIAQLKQALRHCDDERKRALEDCKYFKLELLNREEVYNKQFARGGAVKPNAGPLAPRSNAPPQRGNAP